MLAERKGLDQLVKVVSLLGPDAQDLSDFGRYFFVDELHSPRLGQPRAVVLAKLADELHVAMAIRKEDPRCLVQQRNPLSSPLLDNGAQQLRSLRDQFQEVRRQLIPVARFLDFTKNGEHVVRFEPFFHADSLKERSVRLEAAFYLEEIGPAVVLALKSHCGWRRKAGSSPDTMFPLQQFAHQGLGISGAGQVLETLSQVGVDAATDRLHRLSGGIWLLFAERHDRQKLLRDQSQKVKVFKVLVEYNTQTPE